MKKVITRSFAVFVLGLSLVVSTAPAVTTAAGLVPESCQENVQNCNFCTLMQMTNNLIQLLFEVMTIAAVILVVVAGFKLVTSGGNPGAMKQAKEMLTNVIIGFIIVLSAWLIVDTVIKALMGDDNPQFGPWNELQTQSCGGIKINPDDAKPVG